MTVEEFNSTLAKHKLKAPPEARISILREQDGEMLVEVLNKRVWVQKRITEPYTPTYSHAQFNPSSSICATELCLPPSAFKLLIWIRSLDNKQFTSTYAGRQLSMSEKTVREAVKVLKQHNKIAVDMHVGAGYTVEVIQ